MAIAPIPTTLNDPDVMFTEDIIADDTPIPAMEDPHRVPVLRVYARGKGNSIPDIVTRRTEAYIISWREKLPTDFE